MRQLSLTSMEQVIDATLDRLSCLKAGDVVPSQQIVTACQQNEERRAQFIRRCRREVGRELGERCWDGNALVLAVDEEGRVGSIVSGGTSDG